MKNTPTNEKTYRKPKEALQNPTKISTRTKETPSKPKESPQNPTETPNEETPKMTPPKKNKNRNKRPKQKTPFRPFARSEVKSVVTAHAGEGVGAPRASEGGARSVRCERGCFKKKKRGRTPFFLCVFFFKSFFLIRGCGISGVLLRFGYFLCFFWLIRGAYTRVGVWLFGRVSKFSERSFLLRRFDVATSLNLVCICVFPGGLSDPPVEGGFQEFAFRFSEGFMELGFSFPKDRSCYGSKGFVFFSMFPNVSMLCLGPRVFHRFCIVMVCLPVDFLLAYPSLAYLLFPAAHCSISKARYSWIFSEVA